MPKPHLPTPEGHRPPGVRAPDTPDQSALRLFAPLAVGVPVAVMAVAAHPNTDGVLMFIASLTVSAWLGHRWSEQHADSARWVKAENARQLRHGSGRRSA
jgi:hypothetical protein